LAEILAQLLPSNLGLEGSISTVPGCFHAQETPGARSDIARRLLQHAVTLWRLRESGGPTIGLALEPEPACMLETIAQVVSFFETELFSPNAVNTFAALTKTSRQMAEQSLRRHLGVCLDACHAAVEFENPLSAVTELERAGIRIL